eukprot:1430025-Rhodomonas_salina.1
MEHLTRDLLLRVMASLDVRHAAKLSQTSRSMRSLLVEADDLWQLYCQRKNYAHRSSSESEKVGWKELYMNRSSMFSSSEARSRKGKCSRIVPVTHGGVRCIDIANNLLACGCHSGAVVIYRRLGLPDPGPDVLRGGKPCGRAAASPARPLQLGLLAAVRCSVVFRRVLCAALTSRVLLPASARRAAGGPGRSRPAAGTRRCACGRARRRAARGRGGKRM